MNVKLNSMTEIIMDALFGLATISGVIVALTGVPVTSTTRAITAESDTVSIDSYTFEKDPAGVYRYLVINATLVGPLTYDTIGIVSSNNILFVAESVPETTIEDGDVRTISFRIKL